MNNAEIPIKNESASLFHIKNTSSLNKNFELHEK